MSIVSGRSVKGSERKKENLLGAALLAAFGGAEIPKGWRQSFGLC